MVGNGLVPPPPESGHWRISCEDAFAKWYRTDRSPLDVQRVHLWLQTLENDGPPPDAVELGNDFYLAGIPGTGYTARFLVVGWEYLIQVKDFL